MVEKDASGVVQKQVDYTYDVFGRRIGKTVDPDGPGGTAATSTWTVYDGFDTYADFDDTGSLTTRYLNGPAVDMLLARVDASGDEDWYLTDNLASVRQIVDTDGTVLDAIDYDSYGNILSETNPTAGDRFKYTAREWDAAVDLYFYRARYYDPAAGRFISEDPIGFEAGDANLSRYVGNDPANSVDPSGLDRRTRLAPGQGATTGIDHLGQVNPVLQEAIKYGWPVHYVGGGIYFVTRPDGAVIRIKGPSELREEMQRARRRGEQARSDDRVLGAVETGLRTAKKAGEIADLLLMVTGIGAVKQFGIQLVKRGILAEGERIVALGVRRGGDVVIMTDRGRRVTIAGREAMSAGREALREAGSQTLAATVKSGGRSMRARGAERLREMGLEGVDLVGKSFNAGRRQVEKAGFVFQGTTRTGRRVFYNPKTGARVYYDSGKALAKGQKPHWHCDTAGGQRLGRTGRPVDHADGAAHIPAK